MPTLSPKILSGLLIVAGSLILLREGAIADQPLPAEASVNVSTGEIINNTIPGQASGFMQIVGIATLLFGVNDLLGPRKNEKKITFVKEKIEAEAKEEVVVPATIIPEKKTKEHKSTAVDYAEEDYEMEDLAPAENPQSNILETVYRSHKPHVFVSCETNTGKTFFLLGLIKHIYQQTNGRAEFYISSIKEGNFMGLQRECDTRGVPRVAIIPATVRSGEDEIERQADLVIEQLDAVLFRLEQRGKSRSKALENNSAKPVFPPIIAILDELPTMLAVLEESYSANRNKDKENKALAIKRRVAAIARIGREDNGRVFVLGQGYQVGTIGIDTDTQLNFIQLILGRCYTDEHGIKKMACSVAKKAFGIKGTNPIASKAAGLAYWEEFKSVMESNLEKPVIWNDIEERTIVMPDLSGIDYEVLPHIQSVETNQLTNNIDPWEGES